MTLSLITAEKVRDEGGRRGKEQGTAAIGVLGVVKRGKEIKIEGKTAFN